MFKSYYLAKIIHKLQIPSFNRCTVDSTARVDAGCALTRVTMGRYSYVGGRSHITNAVIGNFCSIGLNCGIGGGIHPLSAVSTSPVFTRGRNILGKNFAEHANEPTGIVEIGSDVWIGEGVYIKAGVKIGTGAVVGAHTVVTHDVEPYTVVAGAPAKTLRKRFDDSTIAALLESQWWQWPDEKLQRYAPLFDDPGKLLAALNEND